MNRDQAKEYAKQELGRYLSLRGINTKKPFKCLNPAHTDRKPSMSYNAKKDYVHCFSCDATYDIFDVIGLEYGLTDDKDKFNKTYEELGITIDEPQRTGQKVGQNVGKMSAGKAGVINWEKVKEKTGAEDQEPEMDFREEAEAAHEELLKNDRALAYFTGRGYSLELIKKKKLGYHSKGYNDLVKKYPQCQSKSQKEGLYRFVYPNYEQEKCTYLTTEIIDRTQIDDYNGKYRKMSGRKFRLYNEALIREAQAGDTIFICEGIPDALSIEMAGGLAIALGGTSYNRLKMLCEEVRPKCSFVICLDNDQPGQDAAARLAEVLREQGLSYRIRERKTAEGAPKDANEELLKDRAGLENFVQGEINRSKEEEAAEREERKKEYLAKNAANQLRGLLQYIDDSKNAEYFSTGFSELDKILGGGLYAGFYVMGAISSLGKTTFALQVADNIAQQGKDVMIISLEMSQYELMAKSISRLTLYEGMKRDHTEYGKSTRGILKGDAYEHYTKLEKDIITAAIDDYRSYADHIFIVEGIGNIGVEAIREKMRTHRETTGKAPVLIIDYLQILAPYDIRATDKQNTDKAVLELKRLSRDFNTPIIGISSFNRDNYTDPVNMTAFKESGAIEYSSDVLIGLQYAGMDFVSGESDKDRKQRVRGIMDDQSEKAKDGEPQSIELKVLKNRNGYKGYVEMEFIARYNLFKEKSEKDPSWSQGSLNLQDEGFVDDVDGEADNLFN